jgi:type 1 glutamine amidotransferase
MSVSQPTQIEDAAMQNRLMYGILVRIPLFMGALLSFGAMAVAADAKNVLLIGMKRDHPPGTHEYMAGLNLLKACFDEEEAVKCTIVAGDEPWPEGPELIAKADAIVLSLGQGGRWIQADPKRLAAIEAFCRRGGGVVAIHWAIGAKDGKYITPFREIIGGIHGGADRKYILCPASLTVVGKEHPIMAGVTDLEIDDEWYYQLKFSPAGKATPLYSAKIKGRNETVAWAYERADGGRSFGFSGLHYHRNWRELSYRRMVAQSVLWALDLPVPEDGLACNVPESVYQLANERE